MNEFDQITKIEEEIKNEYGFYYSIIFCSATAALFTAAVALNLIKKNIILPPITYAGSLLPIFINNKIYLSDYELNNPAISIKSIKRIVDVNKINAIVHAPLFNNIKNLEKLFNYCKANQLIYILDASQLYVKDLYYYSNICIKSFSLHKRVSYNTSAGCILTNDEHLYNKLLLFSKHSYFYHLTRTSTEFDKFAKFQLNMNFNFSTNKTNKCKCLDINFSIDQNLLNELSLNKIEYKVISDEALLIKENNFQNSLLKIINKYDYNLTRFNSTTYDSIKGFERISEEKLFDFKQPKNAQRFFNNYLVIKKNY